MTFLPGLTFQSAFSKRYFGRSENRVFIKKFKKNFKKNEKIYLLHLHYFRFVLKY